MAVSVVRVAARSLATALFADGIRLAEPGQRCIHDLACATPRSGPGLRCHGDHRTPSDAVRPAGERRTRLPSPQQWVLEPWEGEDPPSLAEIWSRKPKFAVNGSRSCAELAIVHHLRDQGWRGIWVNSFGPRELRSEWFPAAAAKTLAETGAPRWAVEAFDRLRAANGGSLGGFFDVFAWREPGQVRFCEATVGPDRVKPTQLRVHRAGVAFPPPRAVHDHRGCRAAARCARSQPRSACEAVERDTRRPMADQLRSNRQGLLRRAARDMLRELDRVTGPDEPETRLALRDVAAVEARREDWSPE
jgi:hypothetical protein